MDAARLLGWIDEPGCLDASAAKELNEIVESFPFFVGARMLHLKALENTKSFRYNGQLKKTAAHTPDRSVLFDYITQEHIAPQAQSEQRQEQKHQQQQEQRQEEERSQSELNEQGAETANSMSEPEPPKRQLEDVLEENDDAHELEDAIREEGDAEPVIGRPLKFNRTEQHSFSEWLKLTSMTPIEREQNDAGTEEPIAEPKAQGEPILSADEESHSDGEITQEVKPSLTRQDLIDRFLAESPRMSPPQKNALGKSNVAKTSLEEDESLMTETLARVYTEQGLYDKAIKAYRLLTLKYPEKSGYFADRINEIKDLKERK